MVLRNARASSIIALLEEDKNVGYTNVLKIDMKMSNPNNPVVILLSR
jgi:hypothetical protein